MSAALIRSSSSFFGVSAATGLKQSSWNAGGKIETCFFGDKARGKREGDGPSMPSERGSGAAQQPGVTPGTLSVVGEVGGGGRESGGCWNFDCYNQTIFLQG